MKWLKWILGAVLGLGAVVTVMIQRDRLRRRIRTLELAKIQAGEAAKRAKYHQAIAADARARVKAELEHAGAVAELAAVEADLEVARRDAVLDDHAFADAFNRRRRGRRAEER